MAEKVFNSIEARDKAIDEISLDAPPDVERDQFKYQEWIENTQKEIKELQNAKIDPEAKPEEPKPDEPKPDEPKPDLSQSVESEEITNLRRQLDMQHRERLQMQDEANNMKTDYEAKLNDLSGKLKELEEKVKNPPQPEKQKEDFEIKALENEIEIANREMTSLRRDDDPEKYDSMLNKKIDIGNKINQLRIKRDQEFHAQHRAELQKMKDEAKKRDERTAAEREEKKKRDAQIAQRDALLKEVNSFASSHDEFKTDMTYEQMYHEYDRFAEQVAADYWGKPAYKVAPRDKELAMIKYKQQNPMIMESLKKKGIIEPKNFKIYDTLSKIVQLKQGYRLNEDTGEFYEYKDGAGVRVNPANMDHAYDHLQKISGKHGQDLIQAMRDGAAGATAAMNQRANPQELDEGQQKQDLNIEIKPEEALEMLSKKDSNGKLLFDEQEVGDMAEAAHRAGKSMPIKVKEYNKYAKALGQPSIEETLGLV